MKDQLLSVDEASKVLNVSIKTLHRWEEKGLISPDRTTGGHRRYSMEILEKFKKNGEQQAISADSNLDTSNSPAADTTASSTTPAAPTQATTFQIPSAANGFSTSTPFEPTDDQSQISENKDGLHARVTNTDLGTPSLASTSRVSYIRNFAFVLIAILSLFGLVYSGMQNTSTFGRITNAIFNRGGETKTVDISLDSETFEDDANSVISPTSKQILTINANTFINGTASVSGTLAVGEELTVSGDLIAPNILYSIIPGENISIGGDSQNPTISAEVGEIESIESLGITFGTGIGFGADGLTLTNTGVTSISGTGNQILASSSTGAVTLSTPQDIHTGASPTFANMTLSTDLNIGGYILPTTVGVREGTSIVTVDTTGKVGQYNSMQLGSDGFARIAYFDSTNSKLKFALCTDDICSDPSIVQTLDNTADTGRFNSMALDSSDLPRISYFSNATAGDQLRYLECDTMSCNEGPTATVIATGTNAGRFSSIAVGSDNKTSMIYRDANDNLIFVHCSVVGDNCATRTSVAIDPTVTLSGSNTGSTSLKILPDGTPVIAYHVGTDAGAGQHLRVAHCATAGCNGTITISYIDEASGGDSGFGLAMAIGNDGLPRIAYLRESAPKRLRFIRCLVANCSSTSTAAVVDDSTGDKLGISLVLDSSNFPRISYKIAATGNGSLLYAACNDLNCSGDKDLATVDGSIITHQTSIDITSSDIVRISYNDQGASGDLRLATINTASGGEEILGGSLIGTSTTPFSGLNVRHIDLTGGLEISNAGRTPLPAISITDGGLYIDARDSGDVKNLQISQDSFQFLASNSNENIFQISSLNSTTGVEQSIFLVDAQRRRIGINNAEPAYTLDVIGEIQSDIALRVGSTGDNGMVIFHDGTSNEFTTTLQNETLTVGSRTITIPDTGGQPDVVCLVGEGNCGGNGGSSVWSDLTDPVANLALTMGAYASTLTYNATTGTSNLFNLTDTAANTGTGYLLNLTTASGSTLNPLHISADGNEALTVLANGNVGIGTNSPSSLFSVGPNSEFVVDNTGSLTALGIDAGSGLIEGIGGLTISGDINLADLTPSRAVFTDSSNNLASSGTSANLSGSLTDETGTGIAVFGTSPTLTTSLLTNSLSFDLLNTTATTLNIGGVATTVNLGASTGIVTIPSDALNISNGVLQTGGEERLSDAGALSNITGYIQTAGAFTATLNTTNAATFGSTTSGSDLLAFRPQSVAGVGSFTGTLTTADLTADRTYTFPNSSGTVCLSSNNCVGIGGGGAVGGEGTLNRIAKFTPDGFEIGDSSINDLASALAITINASGNVGIGDSTPGYLLTVGNGDLFGVDSAGFLNFEGSSADVVESSFGVTNPTGGDQIYLLPDSTLAGTYTICTTANNCTGLGAFIHNSTASQSNANFNIQSLGDGSVTGVLRSRASQTADLLQLQNSTGTASLAGFNSSGRLYYTDSGFDGLINQGTLTDDRAYSLPNASGTFCLTSGNCAGLGGNGDILNNGQDGPITIGTNDNANLLLETDDTTRLTILGTGNIGINNSAPTGIFQVNQSTGGVGTVATNGTAILTGTNTEFFNTFKVGDTITVTGETDRTIASIVSDTSLTVTVDFATTASGLTYTLPGGNRLTVLGNGNVGIGTATPTTRLEIGADGDTNEIITVKSAAAAGIEIYGDNDNNDGGSSYLQLAVLGDIFNYNVLLGYVPSLGQDPKGNTYASTLAGAMFLGTSENGFNPPLQFGTDGAVRMTIEGGGEIGIGDTSPDASLEIISLNEQLRLTRTDNSVDSRFVVDSSGNLTIDNTGTKTVIADDLQVTGDDILDSAGITRLTLGSGTTLTNSALTLLGTTGLTAASLTSLNCSDCINYDDMSDSLTLDAATSLAQGTNVWTQSFTGTGTTGFAYTANSLTSGIAHQISSTATAFTGNLFDVTLSGSNAANTGTLLSLTNSGTANANTSLYLKHYATGTSNLALRVDDISGDTTPFVIDGTGNIGIGTAAPLSALDINGGAAIGSYAGVSAAPSNGLIVSGNVGIGDISPISALTVGNGDLFQINSSGVISAAAGINSSGIINFSGLTASKAIFTDASKNLTSTGSLAADQGGTGLTSYTSGDMLYASGTTTLAKLPIGSNGLCLIVTASLPSWGSCSGTPGGTVAWDGITNPAGNAGVSMGSNTTTFTYGASTGSSNLFTMTDSTSNTGTGYLFNLVTDTGSTLKPLHISSAGVEALTVDQLGQVGIGTTAPGAKLDVNGVIQAGSGNVNITTAAGNLDAAALGLTSADGTGSTSSGSGFELSGNNLGLLQGCADAQTLKWDDTTSVWKCGSDRATVQIRKTADETVASGTGPTIQDDDELTFAVGANENWIVQVNYTYTTNSSVNPDIQVALSAPTASTCTYSSLDMAAAGGNNFGATACDTAHGVTSAQANTKGGVITGSIATGANSGNITFRWTQRIADGTNGTTVKAGSSLLAYKVTGADLAEVYYTHDGSIQAGDIVRADSALKAGVRKTGVAYDTTALGIVSTQPGQVLGSQDAPSGLPVILALAGRVPVKVTSDSPAIAVGDFVTTSPQSGKAMKATRPGQMIGKALETWIPDTGKDTVMVFVNLTYGDPNNTLASLTFDDSGNLVLPEFDSEAEVVALGGEPIANSQEQTAKHDLGWTLADIVRRLTKLEEANVILSKAKDLDSSVSSQNDNELDASDSARLDEFTDKVASNSSEIENFKSSILNLDSKVASIEASLNLLTTNPYTLPLEASSSAELGLAAATLDVENMDTKSATISQTLAVGGRTTLSDVGITGDINIGLLTISGLTDSGNATINTTSGALKLQSDGYNGIDILDGKVMIATNGDIKTKGELTVKKLNLDTEEVAAASLGEGILNVGEKEIIIKTSSVTEKSKIFITFNDDYFPATRYWISKKSKGVSFTTRLDKPVQNMTNFNWWIVN